MSNRIPIYDHPTHWKLKIETYLGNDGVRDYYLCEGQTVFILQGSGSNAYTCFLNTIERLNSRPWETNN